MKGSIPRGTHDHQNNERRSEFIEIKVEVKIQERKTDTDVKQIIGIKRLRSRHKRKKIIEYAK